MHAARERADADERRGDVGRLGVVDVEDAVDASRPPRAGARRRAKGAAPARTASGSIPRASVDGGGGHRVLDGCAAPRSRISAAAISGSSSHHSWPARSRELGARRRRRSTPAARAAEVLDGQARAARPRPPRAAGGRRPRAWRRGRPRTCRGGPGGPRRRLSRTAASGANASVSSSWNDDASQTIVVSGASVPGSDVSAVPTLPATVTGSPASRWMWPISSTVVVLPLEPVTAMNSCSPSRRQPSLELAEDGDPPLARRRDHRRLLRHAGALDQAAGAVQQIDARRARARPPRRPAARSTASSRHGARVDPDHLRPALAQRERGRHARAGEADDEVRAGRERRARDHGDHSSGRGGAGERQRGWVGRARGCPGVEWRLDDAMR